MYRIQPVGGHELVYIGQTGRSLRERLMTLRRHSMAIEMPFNDPHTAAPSLWALHDAEHMEFACSAAPTNFSKKVE
jgi:hypothetical protein